LYSIFLPLKLNASLCAKKKKTKEFWTARTETDTGT
jgi:hypothetical protein